MIKTLEDLIDQCVKIEANDWIVSVLYGLAVTQKEGVYGEIGFRHGTSALALCLAAKKSGGKVYSMDIEPCEAGRDRLASEQLDGYHTFIHGDSGVASFPEKLDLLFIDGSHRYEDVKLDFQRHASRVKSGRPILFHDPVSYPKDVGAFLDECEIPYFTYGAGLGMWVMP